MARRAAVNKKVKKAPKARVGRSENFFINKKYLGNEPEEGSEFTGAQYTRALTWYNYQCDVNDAREFLKQYLTDLDRDGEAQALNGISDTWIPLTACWGARMITRGCAVPDSTMEFIENKIEDMFAREKKIQEEKVVVEKASAQDKFKERLSQIIGDIDALLDTGVEFSLYEWLKVNNVPVSYMQAITEYYTPIVSEYAELLDFEDEQLMDAYAHMSPEEIEERGTFLFSLVEDAERYGTNAKAARAPRVMKKRKKKEIPTEKKLQHFKYQKEDIGMKLTSVNPEKILGAKELWTYNTRYKIITVMRAADGGLDVKGTTVINIDEANSGSYRTGRKPQEIVNAALEATKLSIKNVVNDLYDANFSGRINENTILLRVIA